MRSNTDAEDSPMNAISFSAAARTETLRFASGSSWLGQVLVAVSGAGLAAVLLGDDDLKLRRELTSVFPDARFENDEAGLGEILAAVIVFLEAPGRGLAVPLDLRGDARQLAVWQALRAIPAGETTTYGQIAKTLPVPATAQEVGAACAANVLAVAVPCHRVVKADGSLSGYRWGVWRKKKLINREAVA